LLLHVIVLAANISDREGGKQLLKKLLDRQPALKLHLYADGGYQGPWEAWVKANIGFTVQIVKRTDANVRGSWLPKGQALTPEQIKTFRGHRSFQAVKKRWIVERSIAWLTFQRRLNRDYDYLPETTAPWVHLAFIHMMIRRLADDALPQLASPMVATCANCLSSEIAQHSWSFGERSASPQVRYGGGGSG
jgi:transposase